MATSSKLTNKSNSDLLSNEVEVKDDKVCTVCQAEGETNTPIGYCKTCKDHLCKRCFKGHKVLQNRGHVLINNSRMPKVSSGIEGDVMCSFHNLKPIMYHCNLHSFFGCSDCYTEHSKSCQSVSYIPDVADTAADSRRFKDTRKTMTNIAFRSKTASDGIQRKTDSIDRYSRDAKAELDSFKLDLIQAIEEHVEQLKETIYTVENMERSKLEKIIERYNNVQSKAERIVARLDSLKNKNNTTELYITIEKCLCEVPALQYELLSGNMDQCMKSFKYIPNQETLELMKKSLTLGDIRTSGIVKVEHIGMLEVKVAKDTEMCSISGSALVPEGMIIVADQSNKKLKLFDTDTHKNISDLNLTSKPGTLAKITDASVAVSIPDEKKVLFIRCGQKLVVERELALNGCCNGLTYGNGLLVVSYTDHNKVELMDIAGRIVRIIESDCNGQKLFSAPNYVSMDPVRNIIYVSNYSSKNVLCIDMNGDVLYTYSYVRYPRQTVITEAGQVLLCEENPPVIRKLEKGNTAPVPFLSAESGLTAISHMCYDESEEKLFVFELSKDIIKVFRILYS